MAAEADPQRAIGMQAYMKSTMPFYGLRLPVDELAMMIGDLLRKEPKPMRPLMRRWSTDPNMWKRRVSIICQLRFKKETDLDLLYSNIEPNLADKEFFIRKAIGWALRQYAWTDPQEVARYVRSRENRLSGLSKREALKNI
jgi:3-methyladenine DNA glycosylase AlkD